MKEHEYLMFTVNDDPRVGVIKNLDGKVEEYWRLTEGMRVTPEQFPANVELDLSKDEGNLLTDFLDNIHSVVMVSSKAKAILESEGLGEEVVQFLRFTLRDKKRKKVPEPYFIANALQCIDCFDWERSVYEKYPGTQEVVTTSLRKLYIIEDKVPETARFFRLDALKSTILIRSDLLKRLQAERCTGLCVLPIGTDIP